MDESIKRRAGLLLGSFVPPHKLAETHAAIVEGRRGAAIDLGEFDPAKPVEVGRIQFTPFKPFKAMFPDNYKGLPGSERFTASPPKVPFDPGEPNGYPWLSPDWEAEQKRQYARIVSMSRAGYDLMSGMDCFDPATGRWLLRWVKRRPSPRLDGLPKPYMRLIGGWCFCGSKTTRVTAALDAHKCYALWLKKNGIASQ